MNDSRAAQIRKVAHEITQKAGGTITVGELRKEVMAHLSLSAEEVRDDFFLVGLISGGPRNSIEFRVNRNVVELISTTPSRVNNMSVEGFIMRAVDTLPYSVYPGAIHTVHSGLNKAVRELFGVDPIEVTKNMVDAGQLYSKPVHGGVLLSKAPMTRGISVDQILERMGL